MNEDNNKTLAEVYQSNVRQVIIIFPNIWKYDPNGNWWLAHKFNEALRGIAK